MIFKTKNWQFAIAVFIAATTHSGSLLAGSLEEIKNYREYSPKFSSAGQPSKAQLELLKKKFYVYIYSYSTYIP